MKRILLIAAAAVLAGCASPQPSREAAALQIMTGRYAYERKRANSLERELKAYRSIFIVHQTNKAKESGK